MAGEIIYSVFVSSTYEDLREERAEVEKSLLKLRCMPIGMELFGSADEETWEFIKRQITECDYYVVVIADRYGSIAADGLSYTEKEYDYAKEIEKPVLAFIHGDRGNIVRDKTERDPERRTKLDAFIQKVRLSPVSCFTTPHDLAAQVIVSFVNLRDHRPAIGYVRADQVADLKKYAEVLEEKSRLERELAELKISMSALFPDATESVQLVVKVGKHETTSDGQRTSSDPNEAEYQGSITWGELFVFLAEQIALGNNIEDNLETALGAKVYGHDLIGQYVKFCEASPWGRIKLRLYGWGLIEFDTTVQHIADFHYQRRIWNLTNYGQKQYGLLMP